MERVIIFDTTLRDGEQAPGASLTSAEKVKVARQLEQLGVDVLEAGFPVASPGDFSAVKTIAQTIKRVSVCALARCVKKDIEEAHAAVRKAKKPRLHIFLATSKIHLTYKFKKPESEILEIAKAHAVFARNLCDDVEFSPEDATRTSRDFLFRIIETVIGEGVRTINIPDTVGYSYPQEMEQLIRDIRNNVPNINQAVISVHCHNDLGLATANSLSGILSGARQVHCTVNGIGERSGNASLEEIVMALHTRTDVFPGISTAIHTQEILKTSKLVSNLTGFVVPPNKAIVGANAFRHESGIHQDAILKERTTYEIMDPSTIGCVETRLVLGKHSGRHAFGKRLTELGFPLTEKQLEAVFARFKVLADKKKEIFDEDIIALAEEAIQVHRDSIKLVALEFHSGTNCVPRAQVKIKYKSQYLEKSSTGDGPVDASFQAMSKALKVKPKLEHYSLEAITQGTDAVGKVRVELSIKKRRASGFGSSTDIVEASAKAYLDALSKLI